MGGLLVVCTLEGREGRFEEEEDGGRGGGGRLPDGFGAPEAFPMAC